MAVSFPERRLRRLRRTPALRRLVDAEEAAAAIAEAGAELVLHGHNHRLQHSTLAGPDGPVPVVGVPSASAGPHDPHDPGAYNL